MRVLHIDTGKTMRGGQWQVLYLLQGLAQRGIESRLLAPAGSALLAAAESAGYDSRPLRWVDFWKEVRRFDVVHAHDARAHTLALFTRRPLVVSRRVAFPLKRTFLSRYKYRRPACFLAVSGYVRSILIQAGIPAGKISVVYDGVRVPDSVGRRERTRILALGSDDPAKGQAIVEQASLLADIPVHFSKDLSRDLPGAELFVYITELEGLGSAALLAMAYGVPVLASRAGGLPEIVEHGVTGFLTSREPHEVASVMRLLREDRALAIRLGQAGRSAVEQRFTVAHMVEDTLHSYEGLLRC